MGNKLAFKGRKMAAKFTVYKDKKGEFRFRLLAANGEIIATGESYPTKAAVLKGIASVKKTAPVAEIVEETAEKATEKKAAGKTAVKEKATTKAKAATKAKTTVKETTEKKPRGIKPNV